MDRALVAILKKLETDAIRDNRTELKITQIKELIKFTIEPKQENRLPFLDLCMHIQDDASAKLTINRISFHQQVNFQAEWEQGGLY